METAEKANKAAAAMQLQTANKWIMPSITETETEPALPLLAFAVSEQPNFANLWPRPNPSPQYPSFAHGPFKPSQDLGFWGSNIDPPEPEADELEALRSISQTLSTYSIPNGVVRTNLDALASVHLPQLDDLDDPNIILNAREYRDAVDEWKDAAKTWNSQDEDVKSAIVASMPELQAALQRLCRREKSCR